jgi:hypothetical protein
VQRWLAQQSSWITERLPDEPDANFVYRVTNKAKDAVLISKKKNQAVICIHTRFFSPPSVIRVIDSLSEDQQLELSNKIRRIMADAHITHFEIDKQPLREFFFADHIDIDSLTEESLIDRIRRVYTSFYVIDEALTLVVKRMAKDGSYSKDED